MPSKKTFILLLVLFSSCVKTRVSDKSTSGALSTLPRGATPGGVNLNTATSTKLWGVNGHPTNQVAYWGNIDAQLNLIQEMDMSYYRMDMGVTRTGELTGDNLTRFNELMPKCQQGNITVLPVLISSEWHNPSYTKDDAYYVGAIMGNGFASRYGSYFHTYEIGNEEEGYSLKYTLVNDTPHYWSGVDASHYDPTLLQKTAYYLNGLIEGVRAVDPAAKVIINASWEHYGFFTALSTYNVKYDIIGWHWYAGDMTAFQNTLDKLATFHKDVWFTEINRDNGSGGSDGLNQQNNFVYSYLNELETRPIVKAIFMYELFNQDSNDPNSNQNHYGLISWNTPFTYTAYTKKPVVATVKYEIEENLHGNEDFVYSYFLYCDNRVPDPGGLQYWTTTLTANGDRQSMINIGNYQEANGRFAEDQLALLLDDQTISTDTWNYWLTSMQNGTTREQVIAQICASSEFWTKSGSTVDGFVERLFNRLLGRPSDPGGKTYWMDRINSGTTPYNAAYEIIHGKEYYQKFVTAQFNKLLRRNGVVEQSSIDYYTTQLTNGWKQADLINTLLMSDEYWYRGVNEGYLRRYPGNTLN